MKDIELFNAAKHYGDIVKDEERNDNGNCVRITWFRLAGKMILTVRRNGELFFIKEY